MITITPTEMVNSQGGNRVQMNQAARFQHMGRQNFFQPFRAYRQGGNGPVVFDPEFDGKRLRKSAMRKTVDYNAAIIKMLEARVWQRDFRDRRSLQPDAMYIPDLLPPSNYEDNPINAVTTRFVKTATNKMRCPIFCMAWTPEGRRLVTGASSGEFTLWNGLTFNFETILQAHDTPVRTMVWSHNEMWMVTADHTGYVKYWQSNMNNVRMFKAHQEAIRGISFSPSDSKFASCSDDGTVKIWDFYRCQEERTLRGHGADVKCVHWHPQKGLIISGSKDNQQPVKLWDPKTGTSLATIHAHKSTVMDIKWNNNGNWFVTASRDHLLKLFDIRNLNTEVQVFRGHKKESSSVAWHPIHEGLFCSGGSDGAILFWHVGAEKEVGAIEQAHDSIVWTLAWHPMGHILCSGSNDHTSKFWTRNRPGDSMRDKYNLNTLPNSMSGLEEQEIEDVTSVIPGMGPEDKVELASVGSPTLPGLAAGAIPGLEDIDLMTEDKNKQQSKKVPYSKPIPKNFQAHWNDTGKVEDPDEDSKDGIDPIAILNHLIEQQPGVKLVKELEPEALYIYGKVLKVEPGSTLAAMIAEGGEKLMRYLNSGSVKELRDVIPHSDDIEVFMDYSDSDENEENEKNSERLENHSPTPSSTGIGAKDSGMEWSGANGANSMGFNSSSHHQDGSGHPANSYPPTSSSRHPQSTPPLMGGGTTTAGGAAPTAGSLMATGHHLQSGHSTGTHPQSHNSGSTQSSSGGSSMTPNQAAFYDLYGQPQSQQGKFGQHQGGYNMQRTHSPMENRNNRNYYRDEDDDEDRDDWDDDGYDNNDYRDQYGGNRDRDYDRDRNYDRDKDRDYRDRPRNNRNSKFRAGNYNRRRRGGGGWQRMTH